MHELNMEIYSLLLDEIQWNAQRLNRAFTSWLHFGIVSTGDIAIATTVRPTC